MCVGPRRPLEVPPPDAATSALGALPLKGKARVEDDKDVVFARGLVMCVGQAIGIVVAETRALAEHAARLVAVEYAELPAPEFRRKIASIAKAAGHPVLEPAMRELVTKVAVSALPMGEKVRRWKDMPPKAWQCGRTKRPKLWSMRFTTTRMYPACGKTR